MKTILEICYLSFAALVAVAHLIVLYASIIGIKDELEYEVRRNWISDDKSYWLFAGFFLLHIACLAIVVSVLYWIHWYFFVI